MSSKHVIISVGANADRAVQMMRARSMLSKEFSDVCFTPFVTTPAAPPFPKNMVRERVNVYSNLLASFTTELDEPTLTARLKQMECELDNTHDLRRQGIVMMDIDLLEYDGKQCHPEDWQRPYVKMLIKKLNDNLNGN